MFVCVFFLFRLIWRVWLVFGLPSRGTPFFAWIASAPLETALMWTDSVAKQFHSGVFCLRTERFLEESVRNRDMDPE